MSEKLCSSDAVEMGIDKHMVASLCRLGYNGINMSLVSNSFSCMDIPSFKELTIRFDCVEVRRDNGCRDIPRQIIEAITPPISNFFSLQPCQDTYIYRSNPRF